MASKRQPLTFTELEPKGRSAVLRSREEIEADEAVLAGQDAGIPVFQHSSDLVVPTSGSQASAGRSSPRGGVNRADYPKVTYRISPEALEAIDEVKRILRRKYGVRITLEEIAEEAILMVLQDVEKNRDSSFLVNKFAGKPEYQS